MKSMLLLAGVVMSLSGCQGWLLDYGDPDAQFLQKDLVVAGRSFEGKHITVKGTVTKVDVGQQGNARVYLGDDIECNLGTFRAMAEGCRIGSVVYVDGFLKRCRAGNILLDPAILRDPNAPFKPENP
jgi:hypothetical protein